MHACHRGYNRCGAGARRSACLLLALGAAGACTRARRGSRRRPRTRGAAQPPRRPPAPNPVDRSRLRLPDGSRHPVERSRQVSALRHGARRRHSRPDRISRGPDRHAAAARRPNETVHLTFEVFDPWKDDPVEKFTVVHEKLFHAFIVSRDLQFFVHDHPIWDNGAFHYDIAFPKPGMYRVLGDFYPEAAAPQLRHRDHLRRRRRSARRRRWRATTRRRTPRT